MDSITAKKLNSPGLCPYYKNLIRQLAKPHMLLIEIFTKFSNLGGEEFKIVFNFNNLISAIFSLFLSEFVQWIEGPGD